MTTSSTRLSNAAVPVLSGAAAAVALTALWLRDPHQSGSFGICPSLLLTGLYCPGCGSLRGTRDLLEGDLLAAFGHNALLVPAAVWLLWWWVAEVARAVGRPIPPAYSSAPFIWGILGVVVVFTVLRNLPGSPLAP